MMKQTINSLPNLVIDLKQKKVTKNKNRSSNKGLKVTDVVEGLISPYPTVAVVTMIK